METDSVNSGQVLVLLSGGLDSTACVAFFVEQKFTVHLLFVDYGQLAAVQEKGAAQAIAAYYRLPIQHVDCRGLVASAPGYILGRNAFLMQCGLMDLPFKVGLVAIGIHGGTSYVDCGQGLITCVQSIYDLYTDGAIKASAPFVEWGKSQIVEYLKRTRAPIGKTYSCELGQSAPCGACLSCIERRGLDV